MLQKDVERIQKSILSSYERKVLEKIARSLPHWILPDHLTFLGFLGAILAGIGFDEKVASAG